jgi:hypothetical protein
MLMLERPDEVSAALIAIVRRAAESTPRERAGRRRRARAHEKHRSLDQAA